MSTIQDHQNWVVRALSEKAFRSLDEVIKRVRREHPELALETGFREHLIRGAILSALAESVFRGLARTQHPDCRWSAHRGSVYRLTLEGLARKDELQGKKSRVGRKELEHA